MTSVLTSLSRIAVVRTAALAFWAVMLAWLIRFEAFPGYFTRSAGGYPRMLSQDTLVSDTWMRIRFGPHPVGYSHTSIEQSEKDPLGGTELTTRVHLRASLFGQPQNLYLNNWLYLDVLHRLQRFRMSVSAPQTLVRVNGQRTEEDRFDVLIKTPGDARRLRVAIPDDAVLFTPLSQAAFAGLRPGQRATLNVIDPVTMGRQTLVLEAVRRETVEVAGVKVAATVLSTEYQSVELTTWVDRGGTVLKQETSLGWAMERCSPDDAFAAVAATNRAVDILKVASGPFQILGGTHD